MRLAGRQPRHARARPREAAAPLPQSEQEKADIAFRVIGDHIRTLSFAIADGIQPGNTDRNYVLRRILRRAVRYGRTLGFHEPFFYKLVDVLAATMGDVFPEIRTRKQHVKDVLKLEEEAFNKTLDEGLQIFERVLSIGNRIQEFVDQVEETFGSLMNKWPILRLRKTIGSSQRRRLTRSFSLKLLTWHLMTIFHIAFFETEKMLS